MGDAALRAVAHILDEIQRNPDLAHVISPETQSFRLLCEAQAEATGVPVEQVRADRSMTFFFGRERLFLSAKEHKDRAHDDK